MPNRRVPPPQSVIPLTSAMLVVCVLAPPTATAQRVANRELSPPSAYAITNARIVPVAGPTIERGTIVVRNGVIAAVGANVQAPADARVIDGTGLTVYPGVIDANSSLGLATGGGAAAVADAGRGGRGGGRGAAPAQQGAPVGAPNSLHPVGLQPELNVVDLLHAGRRRARGPAERRHHGRAHRAVDGDLPRTSRR